MFLEKGRGCAFPKENCELTFFAYAMMSPRLGTRMRSYLLQDKSGLLLAPIRKRRRSACKAMYDLSAQQARQTSAGSFTAAVSTTTAVGRNLYVLYNKSARIVAGKEYYPDICGSAHQASSFCCHHVHTGCERYSGFVCPDSPQA